METNIKIQAPANNAEVVSLVLAKANSNIEHDAQDALLELYLDASVEDAENYTGTKFLKRIVNIDFKDWAECILIPVNPLTAISEISYKNVAGAKVVVAAADYELVSDEYELNQELLFNFIDFPELEADNRFPVSLVGVLGYDADNVPKAVQSAILLKFSHKELYREDANKIGKDRSFYAALRPYRKW